MIRKTTWFALVVFAVLVAFAVLITDRKSQLAAEPTATSSITPLFPPDFPGPTGIRVEGASGDIVDFSRDSAGKWVVHAPRAGAADQAAAEAAATQASALRSLSIVDLAPEVVGLDKPQYTIILSGEQTHELRVGAETPVQDGYYVELDGGRIRVVDKFGLEALLGLLSAPPFPATPTAAAEPTALESLPSATAAAGGTSADSTATVRP